MMMRRRAQAQVSIVSLLRTICERHNRTAQPVPPKSCDRCSGLCGRLDVAYTDKLHHVSNEKTFTSCWVELRDDVLVLVESDPPKVGRRCFRPKTITFATTVTPPSASFLTTPDMNMIASKLGSRLHLAVYGPGGHPCIWLAFSDKHDLERWQQAIHDVVVQRDGASCWDERQAAYEKIEPLVWRQVLSQAEKVWAMLNRMQEDHFLAITAAEARGCEQLNGYLQMRALDGGTEHDSNQEAAWVEVFCALSNNLFTIYESAESTIPKDVICLEFANVSANHEFSHAFNLATPVMTLELRADDDESYETWTDTIFALQCTVTFDALVPRVVRKENFFSRLRAKGGALAARMLLRPMKGARGSTRQSYTEVVATEHCDFEISDILKDPKLGALLRAYAEQSGAARELQLLTNLTEVLGDDLAGEMHKSTDVSLLPRARQADLLRESRTYLRESKRAAQLAAPSPYTEGEAQGEVRLEAEPVEAEHVFQEAEPVEAEHVFQEAYDTASHRMMAELLPLFCETDEFKRWLVHQQEDERIELLLLATLQDAPSLQALQALVAGTAAEHVLTAALRIEDLILTSTVEEPRIDLAQQIFVTHLTVSSPKPVQLVTAAAVIDEAMLCWITEPSSELVHRAAIAAFNSVLHEDLLPSLRPPVSELLATPSFAELAKRREVEKMASNGLVHWLHCPPGFNALRTWLAKLRARENIDFICDVMHFKKLEDIASTKEMASRIHAKYIVEGAVAQVCLPSPMISLIAEGLLPKFPSEALFDGAVEHVIAFMQQEMWPTFKQSPEFAEHEMIVSNALRLGGPKLLLSIRLPGGAIRHVAHIYKKMITIGATFDCDVVVKENRLAGTTVLQVDQDAKGRLSVALLWNSILNQRSSQAIASSCWAVQPVSITKSSRAPIIAKHTPRVIRYGETFIISGSYEALILSTV